MAEVQEPRQEEANATKFQMSKDFFCVIAARVEA